MQSALLAYLNIHISKFKYIWHINTYFIYDRRDSTDDIYIYIIIYCNPLALVPFFISTEILIDY